MDCSNYLQQYTVQPDALKKYGFKNTPAGWQYEKNLTAPSLYVRFTITPTQFTVRVIDRTFDDDFLPFSIKNSNSPIKAEVESILADIIVQCFASPVQTVIDYCAREFNTPAQTPWADLPNYYTFKTARSQKWYAIIMHLPANRLGLSGENKIDIINVKLPPEEIPPLIDNEHYFTAYHMNKKHWLTILLDRHTDFPALHALLVRSHNLTEKHSQ